MKNFKKLAVLGIATVSVSVIAMTYTGEDTTNNIIDTLLGLDNDAKLLAEGETKLIAEVNRLKEERANLTERYNELKGNSGGEDDSTEITVINNEISKANDDLASVQEVLDGITTGITHADGYSDVINDTK
ncbi:TPA: hypothetical protein KON86_002792 [Clostridioides difficile]|uniref:hypothetical protein n=1 Tax=Clostridioides difficile TaxID=1496 RepID=UPI0010283621|nr:hypothetical protein [Clostridioides difficile]MBY2832775.1 hypothetical protein [Clostridioides difficile]VFF93588.1 Uncharacterised protein [Clostridioides difficile]VIG04503.1 Uncharacterised protein [Clostridioides difficile]HBF4443162.1 hypothetical protein [Clostridioides difficile]HBF4772031.1 hypothetical protein [Clostridioides difficile]